MRNSFAPIIFIVILAVVLGFFSFWQVPLSFSQTSLVAISEIMYDPVSSEGCGDSSSEWVELKNLNSTSAAILDGWFIKDSTTTKRQFTVEINPGGYLVLVASKMCFLKNHSGVDDTIIIDLDAKIGSGLNNTDSDKDGVADRVILLDGAEVEKDNVLYAENAADEGKSYAFDGTVWKEANLTPGAKNTFPEEETKEEEEAEEQQEEKQQPQPAISFSSPSTVSVGTAFSVTANLSNFDPGTYSLKVLIGKGDKFIYGNTKGAGGWLTQNGKWAEMPRVTIDSSGSKTIQAKTDDDVAAGNYLIKVRVYDGKDTFNSDTKSLTVTGSAKPGGTSRASGGEESGSDSAEEILGEVTGGDGEVKGEEAPRGEGSKLNFYTILGIFGMLVGSGGLILSVTKNKVLERSERP